MAKAAAASATPRDNASRTVKVSAQVHGRLTDLVTEVNNKGWKHLGVSRNGAATFSSVIEEALKQLKRKV